MIPRNEILKRLRAQINVNGHIIGTVAGSGMTARYSAMGGADLLLALSAGKFRIMGRSSFSSYLCYGDSNTIDRDGYGLQRTAADHKGYAGAFWPVCQ